VAVWVFEPRRPQDGHDITMTYKAEARPNGASAASGVTSIRPDSWNWKVYIPGFVWKYKNALRSPCSPKLGVICSLTKAPKPEYSGLCHESSQSIRSRDRA